MASDGITLCFVVVFFVCFLDGADLAVIGATMKSLEESLGLTPFTLGLMAFAQASTCALAGPIWGWMDDNGALSRRVLMAAATFGWGLMLVVTAVSLHPAMLVVARLLNGFFVAALIPQTQAFVCDHVAPERRGRMFGYMGGFTALGSVLTTSITVYVASKRIHGIIGWRLISFLIGVISMVVSFFVRSAMVDGKEASDSGKGFMEMIRDCCSNLRLHWRMSTFRIIIGQGCFGSIPWRAFEFETMFLFYVGFSPAQISGYHLATAPIRICGVTVGGFVGDKAASLSRWHGRAWTAMTSVACGIPCSIVILGVLPLRVGPHICWYIIMAYIFYGTATWCLAGVNRPVLNDIVDPSCRASIIAWDRAIEGLVSSIFGMPLLGFIAENAFGYEPTRLTVDDMAPSLRIHNLNALRQAMLVMQVAPWALCFLLYSGLHFTYKADVQMIYKLGSAKLSEKTPLVIDEEYNAGSISFSAVKKH